MKSLLSVLAALVFAAFASAQCPNGQCPAPVRTTTRTTTTYYAPPPPPVRHATWQEAPVVFVPAASGPAVYYVEPRRVGPVRRFFGCR